MGAPCRLRILLWILENADPLGTSRRARKMRGNSDLGRNGGGRERTVERGRTQNSGRTGFRQLLEVGPLLTVPLSHLVRNRRSQDGTLTYHILDLVLY